MEQDKFNKMMSEMQKSRSNMEEKLAAIVSEKYPLCRRRHSRT